MEPWADELLADDLQSMSFNSTVTDVINRSASSSSETTFTAASSVSGAAPRTRPRTGSRLGDQLAAAVLRAGPLSMTDLHFLRRLGAGDIGAVYLAELRAVEGLLFAAKVMDRNELEGRHKAGRAATEREILEALDHPFLPTLYASVESPKCWCLLTEFCPGGDLHVLRQRQPAKRFDERAVRFYAAEVVVALEYLHMMGIVYRDLKPENVLVRADGHIMLTDFDLSLICDATASTAHIVRSPKKPPSPATRGGAGAPNRPLASSSCILPNCIVPAVSCFHPIRRLKKKKKAGHRGGGGCMPEFVAEPVDVRSMSFVGTHEYLAPEIISGEGHGSAVDWWTLGVLIFELLYGVTPFRGADNDLTLANIVARALEFPKEPAVPTAARELVSQLLVKDPARRLGAVTGAAAVKGQSFFQGVNWALLRCETPPLVPPPFTFSRDVVSGESALIEYY